MGNTRRRSASRIGGTTETGLRDGRPVGRSLTALLRDRLDEVDPESGTTYAERIIDGWLKAAMEGNVSALKEVLDRTEGKVPDKVQVDDLPKAYVTESPDTLWPSDPNSDHTSPGAPPGSSGATPDPSCS